MTTKIITDSSANMQALPGVEFASVPLKIITDKAEYVDDSSLDLIAMIEDLKTTKGKSSTSCPNVADWLSAFAGADQVFAITITSNLSGCYASAVQAKREYEAENPNAKVCVIDSLSTGPEMRLIAEYIAAALAEGKCFETIEEEVKQYCTHTHLLFSLQSLNNLARNGRVSPAVAKIAGVLGIRVVGAASAVGTLEPLHKCRGEKKTVQTVYSEMKNRGFRGGSVRICHCYNLESAQALEGLVRQDYPDCDVFIEPCTALCSFYAEQGGMIIGYTDLA